VSIVPVTMSGSDVEEQVAQLYADLQEVKLLIAPKASEAEIRVYAQVCVRLQLDHFAGQICLMPFWDPQAPNDRGGIGRYVHKHAITVAGRRVIASRTGLLDGIDGPVWCGPRVHAPDCACGGTGLIDDEKPCKLGELVWREVWDDESDYPYAARCLVYVKGQSHAYNGTTKFSEFAQYHKKDGREVLMPRWEAMPSHMLGKTAEALALRRAFPEVAAAVAYMGSPAGDALLEPDDAEMMAEVDAPDSVTQRPARSLPPSSAAPQAGSSRPAAGRAEPSPAPGPAERSRAAGEGSRRRRRDDDVPQELYDSLPEAQGDLDPGRPF
jgi:phage recombination protein Bet